MSEATDPVTVIYKLQRLLDEGIDNNGQVLMGGGDILPTEVSHFSRSEIKDNYRLACQVKVKGDMEIKIPEQYLDE